MPICSQYLCAPPSGPHSGIIFDLLPHKSMGFRVRSRADRRECEPARRGSPQAANHRVGPPCQIAQSEALQQASRLNASRLNASRLSASCPRKATGLSSNQSEHGTVLLFLRNESSLPSLSTLATWRARDPFRISRPATCVAKNNLCYNTPPPLAPPGYPLHLEPATNNRNEIV